MKKYKKGSPFRTETREVISILLTQYAGHVNRSEGPEARAVRQSIYRICCAEVVYKGMEVDKKSFMAIDDLSLPRFYNHDVEYIF